MQQVSARVPKGAPDRLDLGHARAGDHLAVVSVPVEHSSELAREGIVPGAGLVVDTIVPFGGPVITRCGASRIALGRSIAYGVIVETVA